MKHFIITTIAFLATFFCYAQKTYNIGILLDQRTKKVDSLIGQLQFQVRAVVGVDAQIRFPKEYLLVNEFDPTRAIQNYNQAANGVDLVLVFGLVNNNVIGGLDSYPIPTVLFGALNEDLSDLDFSLTQSGIPNFTYLIEKESFNEDLSVFQELTGFKKAGVLLEKPLVEKLSLEGAFDDAFENLNAEYSIIPFDDVRKLEEELEGLDAIYLAGGFLLDKEEVKVLADKFIERKLPSFTSLGVDAVQLGIMGTNQSDDSIDQFFRRIALTVESFVNGESLSELPVFIDYSPRLTINYNTSQLIDVPIKYSLINNTNFVGEPNNKLSKKTFDVLQFIDEVLERNLFILTEEKEVELAGQEIRTAKSNYLPSLTASGTGSHVDPDLAEVSFGQSPEFSTTGNVTLEQILFSESANANIRIQKKLKKAQEEAYNSVVLDIIFDAYNAYFNVLILKVNVQIQMRNLELTRQNLKIAEQNFEAGQSGKSDMLRFQSQLAQDTQAVIEAINQLEQGFIAINQLLNYNLDTELDIADVDMEGVFKEYNYEQLVNLLDSPVSREPFIDFLTQEGKKNAPELKSLKYNIEAVDRNLKLNSAGRFLPTVALRGQYNRTFSRNGAGSTAQPGFDLLDDNYNVGVSVSIPLINRNQTNINRQINIIQKDQLDLNRTNTELAIDGNIRRTVLNVVNQVSNIELSKVSEEAAEEALNLTQTSYSSGAVTVIQLIDAQNNYLNAQLASASALYNFLINTLQLERFLGSYFLLNSEEENAQFNRRFVEFLNSEK